MPDESKKENTVNTQTSRDGGGDKTEKKQVGFQYNKPILVLGVLLIILAAVVFGTIAASHDRFGYRINKVDHMPNERSDAYIGRHGMNGLMGNRGILQDRISGKVTSVNGKSFTLEASGTSYNVQISDSTRFPINSASTVKTSDTVLVWGQKDGNDIIQATQIAVNPQTTY